MTMYHVVDCANLAVCNWQMRGLQDEQIQK